MGSSRSAIVDWQQHKPLVSNDLVEVRIVKTIIAELMPTVCRLKVV
jgi:hypothetical protein